MHVITNIFWNEAIVAKQWLYGVRTKTLKLDCFEWTFKAYKLYLILIAIFQQFILKLYKKKPHDIIIATPDTTDKDKLCL